MSSSCFYFLAAMLCQKNTAGTSIAVSVSSHGIPFNQYKSVITSTHLLTTHLLQEIHQGPSSICPSFHLLNLCQAAAGKEQEQAVVHCCPKPTGIPTQAGLSQSKRKKPQVNGYESISASQIHPHEQLTYL